MRTSDAAFGRSRAVIGTTSKHQRWRRRHEPGLPTRPEPSPTAGQGAMLVWLEQFLVRYPELALFLVIAAGYWIGSFKLGAFSLGPGTGSLFAGLFVGQFAPVPARYTTLLRAIELWGAVRADGPGRLAGDEEPPPVDGLVVCRKQDLSQKIKADPEDRLSTGFVGLEEDRPVFRLPFASRVGERKGYGQHSEKLADPVGVNEVGIFEIEAARLGSREERLDLPPPPVMGQGALGIRVGGDYKQVSADQPHRNQFERRSKRAVA